MRRVLLLGSRGMLARDIVATAPQDVDVVAPPEEQLDITNETHLERALRDGEPDVVINCAAYTNVDGAEAEREKAFLLNAEAVGLIGDVVSRLTSHVSRPLIVHFSTDYVFPGTSRTPYREDDPTEPLGAYGESKLAGERALAVSGAQYLILRTQWLFGLHGKSFPRTMWERATAGKPTKVVNDQVGRPTYTVDLARAMWRLLAMSDVRSPISETPSLAPHTSHLAPLYHAANSGTATWYDLARRVFDAAGVPELLTPCATAEYPTPARRPAWSVLDTGRLEGMLGGPLPLWQDAVDRFLRGLTEEAGSEKREA